MNKLHQCDLVTLPNNGFDYFAYKVYFLYSCKGLPIHKGLNETFSLALSIAILGDYLVLIRLCEWIFWPLH